MEARAVVVEGVGAVKRDNVQVHVEVEGRAKPLDECHETGLGLTREKPRAVCKRRRQAESVTISGGSPVTCERPADSGNVLQTWFCPSCGSTLFAENSARLQVRTVHVGSLEHPENVALSGHIWVSRKLPCVVLPGGHRVFEEGGDWTEDYAQDPSRYPRSG